MFKVIKPDSLKRQARRIAEKKRKLALQKLEISPENLIVLQKCYPFNYYLTVEKKIAILLTPALTETTETILLELFLETTTLTCHGIVPSRSTFLQYLSTINLLRNSLGAGEGFDFLKNTDLVITCLETKYSKSTRCTKLIHIAAIVGRLSGFEICHKFYSDFSINLRKEENIVLHQNSLSDRQHNAWLTWTEIKLLEPSVRKMSPKKYLIYLLYTAIPPRRVMDFALMKIFRYDNDSPALQSVPKTDNFLLINQNGLPTHFSICKYKTFEQLGPFYFDIIPGCQIFNALLCYIGFNAVHNKSLFPDKSGQMTSPAYFSSYIALIFRSATKEIFNKNSLISLNTIRHSFITDFRLNPSNNRITVAQQNLVAFQCGHTRSMQDLYIKFV